MGGEHLMQIGVRIPPRPSSAVTFGAVACLRPRVVEQLGYDHLLAYDHVVGADSAVHQGWGRPLRRLHDVPRNRLVLFGYIAAITALELVTGHHSSFRSARTVAGGETGGGKVDPADQRARPRGPRLRLGVGLGLERPSEYEALGKDFSNRGTPQRRAGRPLMRALVDRNRPSATTGQVERGDPVPAWLPFARSTAHPDSGSEPGSPTGRTGAPVALATDGFPMVGPGPKARRGPRPSSTPEAIKGRT